VPHQRLCRRLVAIGLCHDAGGEGDAVDVRGDLLAASSSPSAWMHIVLWSDAALEVVYGRRSHVGAALGQVLRLELLERSSVTMLTTSRGLRTP
jgi:hypothetical protein